MPRRIHYFVVPAIFSIFLVATAPIKSVAVELPETLWLRSFGGPRPDAGQCLLELPDDTIVVAGTYNSGPGTYDTQGYLLKLSAEGDTIWTRKFGGLETDGFDVFNSIVRAHDDGYVLAGASLSGGHGNWDGWLMKTNSNGIMEWEKFYGTWGNDGFACIETTFDGGYVMTGGTWQTGDDVDMWVVKVDVQGENPQEWTYGGLEYDGGNCLRQTPDGGYVVVGYTFSATAGGSDVYLVRTWPNGELRCERRFGGQEDDRAYGVVIDDDENYVVVGTTNSFGPGNGDVWMLFVDRMECDTTLTRVLGFSGGLEEGNSIAPACAAGGTCPGYIANRKFQRPFAPARPLAAATMMISDLERTDKTVLRALPGSSPP